MKVSLTRTMLGLTTCVAAIACFWPARQVYFHSDAKSFLGRSDYSSRAWEAVNAAKLHWERKRYRTAINEWWQVAAQYRDTEAALAALDNVARASVERKRPAAPCSTAGMRIQGALELDLTADGCFELGLVGFVSALLLAVGADAVGVT